MQYSIVNYSEILNQSENFRLDAEYFKPEYLKVHNIIQSDWSILNNIAKISDGDHAKFPENQKENVRYLRAKDLKGNTILNDDPVYVSNDYFLKQKRSWIESENILLSIMGSVGEIAITPVDFQVCMANRAISIIKKIKENPYYIFVFLITIYGINQIERLQAGGVQERINLDDLRKIRIPKLSDSFVLKIQELALKRFKLIEKSKSLYTEAENLLLSELGLEDWKPQHKLSFVKNFSDTVEAERIDSEYFQPKYEELLRKIKEYKNGFNTLKKIVMLKDKNFNPENKEIYKYIELTNISDNGEIIGYTESLGQDLPTRARRKVQSDDVIVSSIEGSLESVALINDKLDNALCSTGFYINRSKEINSETLLCFVRTIAGQLQLKKGCSGTILTAINKPEYEDILIPKIRPKIQEQIKEKINEMYKSKQESKNFLEKAKRAVEIAIEENEDTAMKYLSTND